MKGKDKAPANGLDRANAVLSETDRIVRRGEFRHPESTGSLRVGVDLGTSSILTIVLDGDNTPLAGLMEYASVVKDGVVYDFLNARQIVKRQKERLEDFFGTGFTHAAAAIPPGVSEGNVKAVGYVLEGADYECSAIVDESTAAAMMLGISDGAVVDVGGGTTGISILKDGKVIMSADEPTGGHHITLVLSGSLGISYEEAERMKKEASRQQTVFPLIRPVVDKMASITQRYIKGHDVQSVYIVGGACSFDDFEGSFGDVLGLPVYKPVCPWLVTPAGIAMNDIVTV